MPQNKRKPKRPPSCPSTNTNNGQPTMLLGLNTSTWVTIGGWLHDVFTLTVAMIDVISDILVAHQFYSEGQNSWGHLVSGSILLSSIVLATIGAWDFSRSFEDTTPWAKPIVVAYNQLGCLHFLVRFVVLLPVAQLLPIVSWVLEVAHRHNAEKAAASSNQQNVEEAVDAINAEEEAERATTSALLDGFQATFQRHLQEHSMFYVETCVESIPQCIIQLLAMSVLQEATPLQLLSMMLSLISIASKGYLISFCFDFKTFVWRFALATHDLFSLFYIFSTLLSPTEPQEWVFSPPSWLMTVFDVHGELRISWLSWLMCWKIVILSVLLFCSATVLLVVLIWHGLSRFTVMEASMVISFFLVAAVVCFIPAVIAAEGVKLASISLLIAMPPFREENAAGFAKLFNFIMDISVSKDPHFCAKQLAPVKPAKATWMSFLERYRLAQYWFASKCERNAVATLVMCHSRDYTEEYLHEVRKNRWACRPLDDPATELDLLRPVPTDYSPIFQKWNTHEQLERLTNGFKEEFLTPAEISQQKSSSLRIEKPLDHFFRFTYETPRHNWAEYRAGRISFLAFILLVSTSLLLLDVPLIAFSALYPAAHAAYVMFCCGCSLNILQSFCLAAVLCCWLVIGLLGKRGLVFACFVLDCAHYPMGSPITFFPLAEARRCLRKFFKPSNREVLLSSVPWTLLPPDVLECSACFLAEEGPHAVDTHSVSLKDIDALKAKLE